MAKSLFWASVAIVVRVAMCSENNTVPVLDPKEWWGPMELRGKQDNSIRRYQVKFEPEMVHDLKDRLIKHSKWTPPLEGAENFVRGFNTEVLKGWLSYWAEEYPFSEREAFFNQFPHFKTNIQGLDMHFIWARPQVPAGVKTVPLLLVHGWPGSVREFYELIPLLTRETPGYDFVFEVIAPSLPGFGFSDAAVRPGLGAPRMAVVLKNLMEKLGFNNFYLQGGDWGSIIATSITTLYPENILGFHSNMVSFTTACSNLTTQDANSSSCYLTSLFDEIIENYAYFHIQATKPDTLGVALTDSPAGLLAYILEKMSTATNPNYEERKDGGLEEKFTKEQLIDNLMLYWAPNCITTSMRIYAESILKINTEINLERIKTPVPTVMLQAKYDIAHGTTELLKEKFTNLIRNTYLDQGGHFVAFEQPKVLAKDMFKAVQEFKEWHEKYGSTQN